MKKHNSKKALSLLAATAMLLTALAGCGGGSSSPATPASDSGSSAPAADASSPSGTEKVEELVIALSADPSTLEPMIQSGQAVRLIKMCMYRGLLAYQADSQIGYEIAESYEVADDNKTYTFHIRPEAKFHNGSDVTAEDVKFSLERQLDESVGSTFRSDFSGMLDSIEALDAKTVRITLKEPSAPFIDYLTLPEAVIVSKAWCEANGNNLDANPMGSGPYMFDSWDKGREIIVKAFDGFYKPGKPETPTLRFVITPDDTTRVNALRTGEADLIDYVPAKEIIALENESGFIADVSEAPFMCLQINCTEGPLADSKVRQAIAYAIDRKGVIDTSFMGRGTEIFGFPTQVGQQGYDGKYDSYFSHDLEKAKALLAEAGYPDGFDVTILSSSTYDFHKQTAIVVQDSLKKIGINAEVDLPDWGTRIERSNVGDYEILVSGTAGNIVDMDWCTNYFMGGETRMNSAPGFSDSEVDSLLVQGRTTLGDAERIEIYDKLRLRLLEQSPFVFINFREQCFARAAYVEGFHNLQGILTYNSGICLEDTYIRK